MKQQNEELGESIEGLDELERLVLSLLRAGIDESKEGIDELTHFVMILNKHGNSVSQRDDSTS